MSRPTASGPAGLEARHLELLGLLAAASFFEGYDLNVVMVALPQLRHSFGLTQSQASNWIALVYLGALPALFWARRADRFGRRRLLLFSIAGYTVATATTALAPDIAAFAVCQLCARAFLALEVTLTWTVLAEELPAGARGYGFGVLAMLNALGAGIGALAWGLLLAPNDLSWRWLYVAATPVLLVVVFMRRRLPESTRFERAASEGHLARRWSYLLRPPYGRLLAMLCAAAVLTALLTQAQVFVVDFMQTERHLSTSAANMVLVLSGALAIPVLVAAGKVSDRLGRKRIGCSCLALSVLGALTFFFLARGVVELFAALAVTYVGQFGAWPTLSGLSTELFPTSHRALARSAAGAATVVGQSASFLLAAVLIGITGNLARSVAVLAAGPLLALAILAIAVPETAGRELEETAWGRGQQLAVTQGGERVDLTKRPEARPSKQLPETAGASSSQFGILEALPSATCGRLEPPGRL
ncbi:MAG TPA: MFS transporter [Acidimicrobiales bacterium]|nr:MFS transporter [Acidimicrobiales bacterium]